MLILFFWLIKFKIYSIYLFKGSHFVLVFLNFFPNSFFHFLSILHKNFVFFSPKFYICSLNKYIFLIFLFYRISLFVIFSLKFFLSYFFCIPFSQEKKKQKKNQKNPPNTLFKHSFLSAYKFCSICLFITKIRLYNKRKKMLFIIL